MLPQRLAYARHMVQTALRDAQAAEDAAPRIAQASAQAPQVQKRAAGLAVWLFG
jgi:hypothetical protein